MHPKLWLLRIVPLNKADLSANFFSKTGSPFQRRSGSERRDVQILQLDSTNNGGAENNNGREVRVMQMDRDVLNGGGGDKDVQASSKNSK